MLGLRPYENPSKDLFSLMDDFERSFFAPALAYGRNGKPMRRSFRTDIRDCSDKYVLEAEMPGFKKEEIDLDLSGDILTISAHREDSKETKEGTYVSRERSCEQYNRSFDISGIDKQGITAEYKDGILELTLPKLEKTVPETRKIELK